MCGMTGILFRPQLRTRSELAMLGSIFTRLLAVNELRGRDASGVALIRHDGDYRLFKRTIRAQELIARPEYKAILQNMDEQAALLIGHARWATVGSSSCQRNAQPLKTRCFVTCNGTIYNADELFDKYHLPRHAETDSELIARLADRYAPDGKIYVKGFVRALRECCGQLSAVVVSPADPQTVIILKGNKPLSFSYHPELEALVYSSDARHLDLVLYNETGWEPVKIPAMHYAAIDICMLPEFELKPFNFIRQSGDKKNE